MKDLETARRGVPFAIELESRGDAVAFILAEGRVVSYRELAGLADSFVARLAADVRLLAIHMTNSLEPLAAYLGALRAGLPVILHGGGVASTLANCPPDAEYLPSDDRATWTLSQDPRAGAAPHPDLAVMLSTSGSTGSSKLVRLSGANLQANADSIAAYLELTSTERAITSLPPSYSYGLSILNSHLSVGASIVLTELSVRDDKFRRLVERHGVTSLSGVPTSYELMEQKGLLSPLPASVKTLTQAGGRMPPDRVVQVAEYARIAGARLFVMYGQTEATARIAFLPPELLPEHAGFIGRPIPAGELWIEGAEGQRLAAGEEGELVYRGPNVMMGYATSREELAGPAGPDTLRTGDIAVEAEPGLFKITGRKSRFVKPFGLRVGLDDLEQRCSALGAAVRVTGDDGLIVLAAEKAQDLEVARQSIESLDLPEGLFEFVRLGETPLLSNSKVDYRAILDFGRAQREAAGTGQDGFAALTILFHRLARGRELSERDSFESLGGDSLSYVQCSIAIEEALGRLPDGWEQMSLPELRALGSDPDARRGRFRMISMESDILVRCGAILLILFQHALSGMQGGADILMTLAGFSWARFQRKRLVDGKSGSVFVDFARRYLSIYLLIICVASALNKSISWTHLTFVSTFLADWGGILNIYWFIESLTWCVGLTCLAFAVPAVRRVVAERPLQAALAVVGLGVVIRLAGSTLIDTKATVFRSPDQMLLYFTAGWAIALAGRSLRLGLFAMLCVASGLAWGWTDTHLLSMACAGAMIVFAPRISLPAPAARAVMLVAAASFYIYLFNVFPMYLTDNLLHAQFGRFWWLQILLSLAIGIGVYLSLEFRAPIMSMIREAWISRTRTEERT